MSADRRVLVAGVGNVFCGDDGFGSEAARRLANESLAPGVTVVDFGIRSVHLAFQLLEPFELVIVLDALARGGAPGTLYLVEPEDVAARPAGNAHAMDVGAAISMAREMGATPGRLLVVGCEPYDVSERLGLSAPVERAIPSALDLVRDVLRRELCMPEASTVNLGDGAT
jgi:hydrogenase maturation protease